MGKYRDCACSCGDGAPEEECIVMVIKRGKRYYDCEECAYYDWLYNGKWTIVSINRAGVVFTDMEAFYKDYEERHKKEFGSVPQKTDGGELEGLLHALEERKV